MNKIFKHFLSMAVLVAAIGCCGQKVTPSIATDMSEEKSLVVLSYNIRMSAAPDSDGPHRWENRKEASLRMIAEQQPVAIGLQELCQDQIEYLTQNLSQYDYIGVGRDDGKKAGEVMAIFYDKERLKLLKGGTFWLSATPDEVSRGWDAACHRTATWALFRDLQSGKRWAMINTHLDHKGPEARREGMKLVASRVEEFTSKGIPVVVTADFNATTDEAIFAPLQAVALDARKEADAADQSMTYNGWGKEYLQIDHIFAHGLRLERFEVLKGDYGVPFISDHYPVALVFQF